MESSRRVVFVGALSASLVFSAAPASAETPTASSIRAGMERALEAFKAVYKGIEARDDYRLLSMEGRPAKLPFPVKSLYVKVLFAKRGKLATVSQSGYVDVWGHVPLLVRKRVTSTFVDRGHRLIRR
jgi:hypothetical protein